jgi:hypothetical protein
MMMRPLGKCVLTLGALMVLASPAWAQGQRRGGFGGPGGFGGGGAFFLRAPNVQKDMKLTDEQVGKVQSTLQSTREKHQGDFAGLRDASPEERRTKMASVNKTITEEVKKGLELSDDQSKRFDQISLQTMGLQAFNDPSVAAKLSLTDDQKSKIREISGAGRGQGGRGAFNKDASEAERAEARKKRAETSLANMTKALDTLTDTQKTTWKELIGTPIEIQYPRPNN